MKNFFILILYVCFIILLPATVGVLLLYQGLITGKLCAYTSTYQKLERFKLCTIKADTNTPSPEGDILLRDPHALRTLIPMDTGWDNYYNGGARPDTRDYIAGTASLSVTTGTSSGWYGAQYVLPASADWRNKAFRFFVKASDWPALETFLLIVKTGDPARDNYFTFNFREYFATPSSNEWQEIIIDKSVFQKSSGVPDWSDVRAVAVRVGAKDNEPVTVWLDELALVSEDQESMISIAFDDGYDDVMLAKPIMDTYNFKGSVFITPPYIGSEAYMTIKDLLSLDKAGWDIGGHGDRDLRTLSHESVERELHATRTFLNTYNFRGKDMFAYPNGGYDRDIEMLVHSYFPRGARTIDGFAQPNAYIRLDKINSKTISKTDTLPEIYTLIDQAIAEHSWLILTWHKLSPGTPQDDVEYSIDGFKAILDYIKSKNIKIVPMSEGLR